MPQNTHLEMIQASVEHVAQSTQEARPDTESLRQNAEEVARRLAWNPSVHSTRFFSARWSAMSAALRHVLRKVNDISRTPSDPDDLRWLRDNMPLFWAEIGNTRNTFKQIGRVP